MGKMPAADSRITAAVVREENKETSPIVSVVNTENTTNPVTQPVENIIQKPQYPTGEFKLNETRVAYVKKGTSFLAIAQQYNVPLARIFEFNEIPETDMLGNDQLIFLQRKRKTGNNEFHIVQVGETLHDIAQSEALRLESLLEYNFLEKKMQPAAGERLYLKSRSTGQPKLVLRENYALIPGTTKN
jgi:LysM repeat protein